MKFTATLVIEMGPDLGELLGDAFLREETPTVQIWLANKMLEEYEIDASDVRYGEAQQ